MSQKKKNEPATGWLMSVIIATWEAETRMIAVPISSGKKVCKTPVSMEKSWGGGVQLSFK
jgi:hypothetical protein